MLMSPYRLSLFLITALASASLIACSDDAQSDASADTIGDLTDAGGAAGPGPNACQFEGTEFATARCAQPTQPPEYYVAEALAYFDTLDVDADRASIPNYADNVARWEWPPWLWLTGYGRDNMNQTADALREFDPSTVPVRDCRFFDIQPFARCYIEFEYEGGACPIYEEFVFDAEGRMTFIEAWSDLPSMLPQPNADRWAEAADYPRLSTRVPGLGSASGELALEGVEAEALIAADPVLADFVLRTEDFWATWFAALSEAPDDFFALGCGW
ncbi:MAG: hypothetical protein ACI81R_001297 [Bradymonadia bacterium]|jgi:hypothetical protein